MLWKWTPSWYICAIEHRTIQAGLQLVVGKRVFAAVFKAVGRHVPMGSQADVVLDGKATNAVRQTSKALHRSCFELGAGLGDGKDEAPLLASAEFVSTYGAIVNALTATIINAEAGLTWLSAQRPDLEEVRRTLNMIAEDSKRAGEIVVRLQAPMKRALRNHGPLDR
ncbi:MULTISPECIES: hypothetical protein [Bradyrhizobium]|uniref:hypothetical protein n=1 Tax=Bradyrhizobium TaxID=374 RepID=UPI00155EA1A1|nr:MULTISPECIES: hypothetical protein [Bradyrhizobium]MDD1523493.1 hypothetical protein [Bradyrhizobium sp. WBAH30]MDD1547578.1 hypothetical protein [Bradyrhizobium sp. WBAH41]MDD1561212.1 hypothetical protein [Bradyrhizobium sp. WBAH23]MDD1568694.1 hypothetical protein [Bradyrhizobium sp. WBAH33]MDD1594541.1 hypothetical protein [Bradyrhizobium sp. WBAH42]